MIKLFPDLLQIAGIAQGNTMGTTTAHQLQPDERHNSEVLDSEKHEMRLDKSNILMLGPTGSGLRFHYVGI